MSKVHFVKSAQKDYPREGIKKGESYYWWQSYRGPRQMSKSRPKDSQTASSEYARSMLALIEQLEACEGAWTEEDRDNLVSSLEQIRDEEQDKFDNMPEGFQQGDTGARIEERVNTINEWIDELSYIIFPEVDDPEQVDSPLEQALASVPSVD